MGTLRGEDVTEKVVKNFPDTAQQVNIATIGREEGKRVSRFQ